MNIRCMVLALACLSGVGCTDQGSSPEDLRALAQWRALGVHDYVIRQERLCFCLNAGRVAEIVVRSDTISFVTPIDGRPEPIDLESCLTVEGLFAYIARAKERETSEIEVAYHALYGYPERLEVDWSTEAIDDEVSFMTFEFRAIR